MDGASSKGMRWEIASAYLASAARIGSWVIISALAYRWAGAKVFAVIAFVRGTIGILNYTTLGLGPAMIRLLAEARAQAQPVLGDPVAIEPAEPGVLSYATPAKEPRECVGLREIVYLNGMAWTGIALVAGVVVTAAYFAWFAHYPVSELAPETGYFVLAFAIGTLLRLCSEANSAMLQTSGQIATDNLLLAGTEVWWVVLSVLLLLSGGSWWSAFGSSYCMAAGGLMMARRFVARPPHGLSWERFGDWAILKRLLGLGLLVTLGQLADYLYAPTDYILISWLLDPINIAYYAPAIQIDAGLFLLVGGVAAVMLPRAALAHAAGDGEAVRRYYVRGTLLSTAVLGAAAVMVWGLSEQIFRVWLGSPMQATQAILPLVLVHTVVGGSSAVGRAILLGMGKVRAFTIAALVGGVSNVAISFVFVKYLNLGLRGIVLGTVVAVVGRCAIWMPWYVMRSLRKSSEGVGSELAAVPVGQEPF